MAPTKNSHNRTILAAPSVMALLRNDFSEKANAYDTNEMSAADVAYYLEVTSRVSQKLLQAVS